MFEVSGAVEQHSAHSGTEWDGREEMMAKADAVIGGYATTREVEREEMERNTGGGGESVLTSFL